MAPKETGLGGLLLALVFVTQLVGMLLTAVVINRDINGSTDDMYKRGPSWGYFWVWSFLCMFAGTSFAGQRLMFPGNKETSLSMGLNAWKLSIITVGFTAQALSDSTTGSVTRASEAVTLVGAVLFMITWQYMTNKGGGDPALVMPNPFAAENEA